MLCWWFVCGALHLYAQRKGQDLRRRRCWIPPAPRNLPEAVPEKTPRPAQVTILAAHHLALPGRCTGQIFVGPSGPAAPTPSFWYVRLSTLVNELRQERQHAVESLAVLPVANPSELKGAREGACLFLGEASQPYGCGAWAAALADHAHFSTVVFADLVSARPPASAGVYCGQEEVLLTAYNN